MERKINTSDKIKEKNKVERDFVYFGRFIKDNWKKILLIEILLLVSTFSGYSCIPLNKAFGIISMIVFIVSTIALFIITILVFKKHDNTELASIDKENAIRFFFYFSSIFADGIILTCIFLIIKAVDPYSKFLIQGIAFITLAICLLLAFGFCIYFDKFISFINRKEKKKKIDI